MTPETFRNYVGFGPDDEACLRAFWPYVEQHVDGIVAEFYRLAMAEPETAAILRDEAQVARLMQTLRHWLRELHNGPWDEEYVRRRARIGDVHVQVGVGHDAMFAAMSVVRQRLLALAAEHLPGCGATLRAIERVTQVDLVLMTGRYHQRREARAVLDTQSLIVSHIPTLTLLLDQQGGVVSATDTARTRFETIDARGESVVDALPEALVAASRLEQRLSHAMASKRIVTLPRVDVELDGQPAHLAVTIVPINADPPLALLHIDDDTMAIQNEAQVQRQAHLAQLGALSATIAHELRNPLAGISGALQIIRSGMSADSRYSGVMQKVIEQVWALNRLVTDLLAFARPRAADLVDAVDLGKLARDVVGLLQNEAGEAAAVVEGQGEAIADPDMVRQIVTNLVVNAFQALNGPGQVRVFVDGPRIVVEDNGGGISAQVAERLFEPFVTTKVRGTGLGLANSRRQAGLMGGELRLVKAPTLGGAAFELQLQAAHRERQRGH
jgi:signal transduction histidine kinase